MTTLNCSVCDTAITSDEYSADDVVTCQECW